MPDALLDDLFRAQGVRKLARHEELSVNFADIRDFTRLTQSLHTGTVGELID